MITGVNEVALVVDDLAEFDTIAAQVGAAREEAECGSAQFRTRNINVRLRLADADRGHGRRQVHEAGITHICVQSREAWDVFAALEAAGVTFNAELTTLGNGTHYAYGALPSGATVEIESAVYAPPEWTGSWISHVAFATPDLARLSGFYAQLTGRAFVGGWQVRPSPANDLITGYDNADMKVGWVACGNIMLEFWQYLHPATTPRDAPRPDGAPGYAGLVFEIEDLAANSGRLAELGVTELGPVDIGPDGAARTQGRDPDGNRIGFVDYARASDRSGALGTLADPALMPRLAKFRATLPLPHFRPEMNW